MTTENKDQFTFEISLSVLNHLGRNLYRSFVTVLGEAISNSWDAGAKNVWIYIDKKNDNLIIKDDGNGMSKDDFQNKFLKIGYSKRKDKEVIPPEGRAFIGRKGIGKLALLSCADTITVISKTQKTAFIGGIIDNSGLDKAITKDLTPEKYPLGNWEEKKKAFQSYLQNHEQGTIIYFENIKGGIKNSLGFLRKIIALYFRFPLIDKSFNILIDDEEITYEHLKELSEKTQFLWNINNLNDPYIENQLTNLKEKKDLKIIGKIQGFIASVETPKSLNIMNMEERVSVDLFVNGRLRERDIVKHIPQAKIVEDYLYGQIHYNELDAGKKDPFTSDREGVIADDEKYKKLLAQLKDNVLKTIIYDWDKWREKWRGDGDPENTRISKKDRKSGELFNVVAGEYSPPKGSANKHKIDGWVDSLAGDAKYNFGSYAECFISENLIRKYIQEKSIPLSQPAQKEVDDRKKAETTSKNKGNISIEIRKNNHELSYLDMNYLAYLADMKDKSNPISSASLSRDADEYKPMRDAVAHTSLLTDVAKQKLNSVYENIKARIRKLLSGNR